MITCLGKNNKTRYVRFKRKKLCNGFDQAAERGRVQCVFYGVVSGAEDRTKQVFHSGVDGAFWISPGSQGKDARLGSDGLVDLVQGDPAGIAFQLNPASLAWAELDQTLLLHAFEQAPDDDRVGPEAFGYNLGVRSCGSFIGDDAQDLNGGCQAGVCGHNQTLPVMFGTGKWLVDAPDWHADEDP